MKDAEDDGAVNTGSNLFVTGIHPRLSEADVSRLFEKYGDVENCSIMVDPHTKESRGFGFVKMVTAEQADAAREGLQGEVIEGRTLSIEKARRARPRTPTPGKYFGPPKRGKKYLKHAGMKLTNQKVIFVDLPVAVVMIVTMIVAVATGVVVMMMAIVVAQDTTHTIVAMEVDVIVMIMVPVALIAMVAVMIVIDMLDAAMNDAEAIMDGTMIVLTLALGKIGSTVDVLAMRTERIVMLGGKYY